MGISVWVLLRPPATSFEVMYQAYPPMFWGLFAVGLVAAMLVFVRSDGTNKGPVVVGIVFLCVLYTLFNFLPLFRGWALYGRNEADVLAHLGTIRTVLRTGQMTDDNFYPFVHVLSAVTVRMGLSLRVLSSLFSGLFVSVYFLGVYLFINEFTGNGRAATTTVAAAIPLLYGKFEHTFHPAMFSFLLLPLMLYLIERHRQLGERSRLLFLLGLATGLVVFHPVTSLYLLVILVTSIGSRVAYAHFSLDPSSSSQQYIGTELVVLLWTASCWLVWYLQFKFVRHGLVTALGFSNDEAASVAQTYGAERIEGARSLTQIVVGFITQYGPIFVVCFIASVATAVIVYRVWHRSVSFQSLWLSSQFVVSLGFTSLGIFTYVVAYNPIRNARFTILFATLITGVCLSCLHRTLADQNVDLTHLAFAGIVVLLAVSVPISAMNTYQPWYHMTYSEEGGTDWIYEHAEEDAQAVSHHVSPKMQLYLEGTRRGETSFTGFRADGPVPRRFGYESAPTVGAASAASGSSVYFVTKEYDTEFYRALKPYLRDEAIVYRESSLRRLSHDPTVNEMYSNGGYSVWRLNNATAPTD